MNTHTHIYIQKIDVLRKQFEYLLYILHFYFLPHFRDNIKKRELFTP